MATEKDKTKAAAVKMYLDEHPALGQGGPVDWDQIEFAMRFADAARADAIEECAKELKELRRIVGRCPKVHNSILGPEQCNRPKGHKGCHESQRSVWLGRDDEPEDTDGSLSRKQEEPR